MNSLVLAIGSITTVPAIGMIIERSFTHSAAWVALATVIAIVIGALHELGHNYKPVEQVESVRSPLRPAARMQPTAVHLPGVRLHHYDEELAAGN